MQANDGCKLEMLCLSLRARLTCTHCMNRCGHLLIIQRVQPEFSLSESYTVCASICERPKRLVIHAQRPMSRQMSTTFRLQNVRRRDHCREMCLDGKIMFKQIQRNLF
jgi:hypothetical protein